MQRTQLTIERPQTRGLFMGLGPVSRRLRRTFLGVIAILLGTNTVCAEVVRVATFNLMNYLCMDRRIDGRFCPGYPKPEAEKAAVREVLRAVRADVVCLQEIGHRPFLEELRQDLEREGLPYPHAAWLDAADPVRHIAVLSRIPFRNVTAHAQVSFNYLGREEFVKRGLLEVEFESTAGPWRLFTMHLKSPLTEDPADPGAEQRRAAEGRAIRDLILDRIGDAGARPLYLVAGDLNASPNTRTLAAFRLRGSRVVCVMIPATDSRSETWTHRYLAAERYERLDYILASPELAGRVQGGLGHIHDGASSMQGSDHRLVWADLELGDRSLLETETPAGEGPAGVSAAK